MTGWLARERLVLQQIVRGEPLVAVLGALCRIVEEEAPHAGTARIAVENEPLAPSPPGAHRWITPIVTHGQTLGAFVIDLAQGRQPTHQERELVSLLAHTAALAITRGRADEALRESEARHRFFANLAAATQPLSDPQDLMATVARFLAQQVGADRCAYARIEDGDFVVTGDWSPALPSIVGRWPVAAFGPDCVRRMAAGEAFVVEDSEHDARIGAEDLPAYRATAIRAVICVPLMKAGEPTAAMAVHQSTPRAWTPAEVQLVRHAVASCWEALERARVTRALQESEARYRAMIEANPECVKLVAGDGRLLRMNAAGLRMLGAANEDEVVGCSIYEVIAPEHREAFRELNERVCGGGTGVLSFDIVARDGTRRSMETTAVPMSMPGHAQPVQLAVTHDVTRRVATDRALAESRARLDYAVRLSGVGFWYCDLPFNELKWDERVRDHFFVAPGVKVDEALFYDRIHPEDRDATRVAIESSIAGGAHFDVVYRTVDPVTGATKWIRALGGTACGPDGTPLRFDGVTLDLTRERQDQQRLAQLLQGERRQARLLAGLARTARSLHASGSEAAMLENLREGARQLLGVPGIEIDVLQPEQGALSQQPGGGHAAPLLGRDARVLGWLRVPQHAADAFSATDAAILAQLAQSAAVALENARLNDCLREQDRRKDEFLATLAHELRNPLAPIRTGLHLLGMTQTPDTVANLRDMMSRQLGHLVRMVDDLLDVSRVTRGKITLLRERVDLLRVVDSALEATRMLLEEHGHALEVRVDAAPVMLYADATRLAQVFVNLLNNAARYTPRGGHLQLHAAREGEFAVVRVLDDGAGIPQDMLERIFDLFTQVDRSMERTQGGLGLGLTLVRRLVELHGGSVSASSAGAGLGSCFTVRLPIA